MVSRNLMRGPRGFDGDIGPMPKHEIKDDFIRFEKDSGLWGDWIKIPSGKDGRDGIDGKDGRDGIDGKDGRDGIDGKDGLKGERGERGPKGEPGERGERGPKGERGERGPKGDDGLSAYEVWLSQGNEGTEEDFFQYIADKIKIIHQETNPMGAGSLRLTMNLFKDVSLVGIQDGQVLAYNASDRKFYPANNGSSGLGEEFETVSKNLKSYPYELNYTGSDLTSIVYTLPSGTITKTLNYTTGVLTSVVLSGDTPSGIDLTKTLTYTGGTLTDVSYS